MFFFFFFFKLLLFQKKKKKKKTFNLLILESIVGHTFIRQWRETQHHH